jgi:hypothetical protein
VGGEQRRDQASNGKDDVVLGGGHTIFYCEYNVLFLAGVVHFLCVGVLLTKEKVIHMTLSTS